MVRSRRAGAQGERAGRDFGLRAGIGQPLLAEIERAARSCVANRSRSLERIAVLERIRSEIV